MRCRSQVWRRCGSRHWMLALLVFHMLLPTLPQTRAQEAGPQAASHLAETQIDVTLAILDTPRLREALALEATVTPLIDAPEVRLRWGLPEGVILLDGPAEESLGPMAAGETRTLTAPCAAGRGRHAPHRSARRVQSATGDHLRRRRDPLCHRGRKRRLCLRPGCTCAGGASGAHPSRHRRGDDPSRTRCARRPLRHHHRLIRPSRQRIRR